MTRPRLLPCAALLATLTLAACSSTSPRPGDIAERETLAAVDGSFDTTLRVAELYRARNDPRALDWYARAAATQPRTHRSTNAEATLGQLYARGRLDSSDAPQPREAQVMRPSPRKAKRWSMRAAYHGSPYAMDDLARWHARDGDAAGVLRWRMRSAIYMRYLFRLDDVRTAATSPDAAPLHALLARIARDAERGDAEAQVDMGALHEAGIGVTADRAEALRWYTRAGEQGNVYGQYMAGLVLGRGGKDLPKDIDAASRWFALAHAQEFYMADESYWRDAITPRTFHFE